MVVSIATDLFLSSRHHTEVFGYQGYLELDQLPAWMRLGQFDEFYDDHLAARAGQFAIGFGDGPLYRSINADVYDNALIGNPIVNPALTTIGVEFAYHTGLSHVLGGISNGTSQGYVEEGWGLATHAKVWLSEAGSTDRIGYHRGSPSRISVSFYRADNSDNFTGYPQGGTKSYLFQQGDRSGARYLVWNGDTGGLLFLGDGQNETAVQLDARLNRDVATLYDHVGWMEDADTNGLADGTPEARWWYYMATARYDITDWLHVAARYSGAQPLTLAGFDDASGRAYRIQAGAGFELYQGILIKAEYVNQQTSDFPTGYVNNQTNLGLDPSFSSFALETSVKVW